MEFRNDPLSFLLRLAQEHGDIVHFKLGLKTLSGQPSRLHQRYFCDDNRNFMKSRAFRWQSDSSAKGCLRAKASFIAATSACSARLPPPAHQRLRNRMTEYAARCRSRWRDGETLDMSEEMMRLTLAIVGKTLFDADVESEAGENWRSSNLDDETIRAHHYSFSRMLDKLPLPSNYRSRKRANGSTIDLSNNQRAKGERRRTVEICSLCCCCAQDEEGDAAA